MDLKNLRFVYLTRGLIGTGGVSNDTAARLWRSLSSACKKHGVSLLTLVGDQPGNNHQQSIFQHIQDGWPDGIISWSSMGSVEPDQDLSRFVHTPVVCLSRKVAGRPVVRIDNSIGMRELISHLITVHNLQKIAFVRGPESHPYSKERWQAYRQTLGSFDIPYNKSLVSPWGNWDKNTGINAVELFLDKSHLKIGVDIQALVCTNDRIAVGVLEELNRRGYRCPQDVYVTGINHLPESDKTEPVLTTVHMPFEQQAEAAVELLLNMIKNPGQRVGDISLGSSLMIRESCGCQGHYSEFSDAVPSPRTKNTQEGLYLTDDHTVDQLKENQSTTGIPSELVNAFESSLKAGNERRFIQAIAEFMADSPRHTSIIIYLQTWFEKLLEVFPDTAKDSNALPFVERMFRHAIETAVRIDAKTRSKEEILSFLRSEVMQKIDLAFALESDHLAIYQQLSILLPKIGIPSFSIVLYESEEKARLEFGYDENGIIPTGEKNYLFPRTFLPLKGDLPKDSSSQYLLRAIAFGSRTFGYVIFGLGPLEGTVYDAIAYKLSSTINNVVLHREIEQKIDDLNISKTQLENSINELKNTQNQLVQSQKMAALGELVAGVAHEMNTPLGVALTASSYLESVIQEWNERPSPHLASGISEAGELIIHNVQRACTLVDHFRRTLDEPINLQTGEFNLRELLGGVNTITTSMVKNSDIKIQYTAAAVDTLNGPAQILQEILVQLISNSVYHGFPNGGPGHIWIRVGMDAEYLMLSVIDDGIGMSEEIHRKAFNPFFTTRRAKGSIGLGLHGLYNMVTQTLGGTIEFTSSPKEGTRVLINLPREKFTSR